MDNATSLPYTRDDIARIARRLSMYVRDDELVCQSGGRAIPWQLWAEVLADECKPTEQSKDAPPLYVRFGDGLLDENGDSVDLLVDTKPFSDSIEYAPVHRAKQANGRKQRKAAFEQLNVGRIRSAIASLPDDTPVWICDDYDYGKFYRAGYQPVTINHDELGYELFIEFHDEAAT